MDSDEERNWVYCGMIKLLGSFLKEKRGDICLYIGFIGVFYVIFSLSNLPVDAVNYAFFLSAIWLLGYGIFKFNQYYKKGVAVIEAKQRLEEVTENLPATRSYIELEYQAIIQNMYKKMSDLQSAERIGRQEMKDYYSMWAHQIKTPIAAMKVLAQLASQFITHMSVSFYAGFLLASPYVIYTNSRMPRMQCTVCISGSTPRSAGSA